jgi:glucose-1-phosphate adenylyltransferase
MIESARCFAYAFDGYWVDVGTIQSYWETSLALLSPTPPINLYDSEWVIHTLSQERPPVRIGLQGSVSRSMVCNGCVVRGAVQNSVLSPGVQVMPGAIVRDSIIMNDAWIGPDAVVDRSIVDKGVVIGQHTALGWGDDKTANEREPDKLFTGISVVGKGARIPADCRIGRNVVVQTDAPEAAFASFGGLVPSGATVK